MAVTLILTAKTPGQTQFGLDTFTEHYKCDVTADVVLTDGSVPQVGSAHPTYSSMFVTQRHCNETSESASALDLIYTGTLSGELPDQKHDSGDAVQSASSSRGLLGTLTSPLTLQYYAPYNTLSYLSFGSPGTDEADDPTGGIEVITVAVGDTSYTPTGVLSSVASQWFTELIISSLESTEIVAGQYWQNISRKTKTLAPYLFSASAGEYITMFAPGSGYTVSDSLTVTDGMGHTAIIVVASLGIGGSIVGFTVSSNSFDYSTTSPITASGGSGSGAGFWNVHIA